MRDKCSSWFDHKTAWNWIGCWFPFLSPSASLRQPTDLHMVFSVELCVCVRESVCKCCINISFIFLQGSSWLARMVAVIWSCSFSVCRLCRSGQAWVTSSVSFRRDGSCFVHDVHTCSRHPFTPRVLTAPASVFLL